MICTNVAEKRFSFFGEGFDVTILSPILITESSHYQNGE